MIREINQRDELISDLQRRTEELEQTQKSHWLLANKKAQKNIITYKVYRLNFGDFIRY